MKEATKTLVIMIIITVATIALGLYSTLIVVDAQGSNNIPVGLMNHER